MKLKRLTVTAIAGLVAATGLLGFAALGGSELTASAAEVAPIAPTASITTYNCFVCYNFKQNDGHSTTIQLRSSRYAPYNNHDMYVYPGHTGSLVALPYTQYTVECKPEFTWYASEVDGLFSEFNQINIFGNCKYFTDQAAWYFRTEEIPTSFDGARNTWEYTCSGKVIHFSLAFHGVVWDGELGHSDTVSQTLTYNKAPDSSETVTFYVRTRNGKISVRASEVVKCNNYDTMFAFEYLDA